MSIDSLERHKRGDEYKLNEEQQRQETELMACVKLLNEKGFNVKYNKYWVWGEDQTPGYITCFQKS